MHASDGQMGLWAIALQRRNLALPPRHGRCLARSPRGCPEASPLQDLDERKERSGEE